MFVEVLCFQKITHQYKRIPKIHNNLKNIYSEKQFILSIHTLVV